jgi:type I restriction enzyme M protein
LRADYVGESPFNDSDWFARMTTRWQFGVPPRGNANFACAALHHLRLPAGFVLANGSMSSNQSGEGEIRKAIVEAAWWTAWSLCRANFLQHPDSGVPVVPDKGQRCNALSASGSTPRPAQAGALHRRAENGDAGDRVHRELKDADIAKIVNTMHLARPKVAPASAGEEAAGCRFPHGHSGFCKTRHWRNRRARPSAHTRPLRRQEESDDGEPLEEKIAAL